MLRSNVRRAVRRLGLTGVARRGLLLVSGAERRIAVDGVEATFEQRAFGDYIELNQIEPEAEVVARLRSEVRPDDVFLDVGSNLGAFAVFVGDRIEDGQVIAVEPVPTTAETLAANLERNGVDATVCRVAFSDDDGTVAMTAPDAHGSSAVASDGDDAAGTGAESAADGPRVEAVRGDEYLADEGLPRPTVVKVDVEGHELAALRGLEATLSRPACRLAYCEVHAEASSDAGSDVRAQLATYGFDVETLTELPGERRILRASRD